MTDKEALEADYKVLKHRTTLIRTRSMGISFFCYVQVRAVADSVVGRINVSEEMVSFSLNYSDPATKHYKCDRVELVGWLGDPRSHHIQRQRPFCCIQSLDLGHNRLRKLPPDIGECTTLRQLNIQGNLFEGEVPDCIGSLTSLVWLSIFSNKFTTLAPNMVALTKLTALWHSWNAFKPELPKRTRVSEQSESLPKYIA